MGFFDNFKKDFEKTVKGDKKYRDTHFENEKSNAGWYYCQQCGKALRKSNVDVDHIYPKSKGGPNHSWNLQTLCPSCNRSKKDSVDSRVLDGYKSKF